MSKSVSNLVFSFRTKRGVTQEEVAMEVGVTRQTVIALEKGSYTPSVSLALRLARFFGVHVEDLFTL